MSYTPIAPMYGAQITGLDGFSDPSSWEGVALLIETLASVVMSQVRGIADWVQGLFADWTSQPEVTHASMDSLIDGFFKAEGGSEEEVKSQKREDIKAAIGVIQSDVQVGSGTTCPYMDVLAGRSEGRASFMDQLIIEPPEPINFDATPFVKEVEKARKENAEFVFVPIVFQSKIEPHIVLFTVNLKENVIEYYDPRGRDIGTQEMKAVKLNVQKFSEILQESLGIDDIQVSKAKHQGFTDIKNCGRFVMHFMKQRLEQASFEDAIHSVKSLPEIKEGLARDLQLSLEMLTEDPS